MIKAVFFDIDGTIFSHFTKQVPPSTKQALQELKDKGVLRVAATGRHLIELQDMDLLKYDFDGYVTLNGQICLDRRLNVIYGNPFTERDRDAVIRLFKNKEMPLILMEKDRMYINYVDDVVIQTQMSTHGTIPDIGEYHGEKIYQCLAFVDHETRVKLDRLLDKCHITSWNDTGIDIIAKTGGKDAGIQKFLDKEDISRKQTMAFGDGENDAPMLDYVELGVAMGNGKQSLKDLADYVTDDIDNDGIEKALIHFGLIQ